MAEREDKQHSKGVVSKAMDTLKSRDTNNRKKIIVLVAFVFVGLGTLAYSRASAPRKSVRFGVSDSNVTGTAKIQGDGSVLFDKTPTDGGSGGGSNGSGDPVFPTSSTTGVTKGVTLTKWPSSQYRSDAVSPTSTELIDGIKWDIYDGFDVDLPAGEYMYIPSGNVMFRNSKFTGHGVPSNTSALIQANGGNWLWFDKVEVRGNGYARGVQSDNVNMKVTNSKFIDTSDSAVEKNDRSMRSDFIIKNNYIEVGCAWTAHDPGAHADGIQWGGARDVTIYNNTVLTNFNPDSCMSNSTIGGWAELGNVNSAIVEHNLLAGGGASVYLQAKPGYSFRGDVKFIDNTFDTRYQPKGGYWCSLFSGGVPSQIVWSGNTRNGSTLSLVDAKSGC